MTWLTPIWLLLLLPWVAACVWSGRRATIAARVPFLTLWPAQVSTAGPRRRLPPVWVMLLLAAVLLTILAAAGPAIRRAPPRLTVVVDLKNAGIDHFAVTLISPPTTGRAAQAMVTVVNATDRRRAMLRMDDVKVSIELPVPADDLKRPDADSLPNPPPEYRERGPNTRDYFVDLPSIGETCEAELLDEDGRPFGDDVAADDHAYLTRTIRPARVEPQTPVSDDLARMIAVYNRRRSSGAGDAAAVAIVRDTVPTGPAVILAKEFGEPPASRPAAATAEAIDTSHPITRSADLFDIATARRSAEGPIGDGWRTLIKSGDDPAPSRRPLLAVRELPARQVWIGFDTGFLAQRADYVIFWTDAFDWLGGGATTYASETVRGGLTPIKVADATLEASPGLYRDGDRTIATAMPAIRPGPPRGSTATSSAPSLAAIATVADPIAVWPLTAAMAFLAVALALGRRLTGF